MLCKKEFDGRCIQIVTKYENMNDISVKLSPTEGTGCAGTVGVSCVELPGQLGLKAALFGAWIFFNNHEMCLISGLCSKEMILLMKFFF